MTYKVQLESIADDELLRCLLPARREKTPPRPGVELRPDGVASSPAPVRPVQPALVEPLAPAQILAVIRRGCQSDLRQTAVPLTASAELRDKLERLRALMRSSVPDGDLAAIIEEAVTEKLERLGSKRFGKTNAPRKSLEQTDTSPSSRYIPAGVKRAVIKRDGSRCTYEDAHGRRCTERNGLQFHHQRPFGRGGDHSLENIHLMCPVHNGYLAEQDYGQEMMERYRRLASYSFATTFNDGQNREPARSGSCAREPAPVYSIGNRAAPAQQVDSFHPRHSGFFLDNSPIAAVKPE